MSSLLNRPSELWTQIIWKTDKYIQFQIKTNVNNFIINIQNVSSNCVAFNNIIFLTQFM